MKLKANHLKKVTGTFGNNKSFHRLLSNSKKYYFEKKIHIHMKLHFYSSCPK